MRPRLFTLRNFVLLFAALLIFSVLAFWIRSGMPLPGQGVPSTAGKIAFVTDRDGGHRHIYMMNGADGGDAAAMTSGDSEDRQPVWSADGSLLAFIASNRGDSSPQVYEMDARPGAAVAPLTHSSATKDKPIFGAQGRVYYLSDSKLTDTKPDGTDSEQILPSFEEMKSFQGSDEPSDSKEGPKTLSFTGFEDARPAPDGNDVAATLKTDRGVALLLYDVQQKQCQVIGGAQQAFFSFSSDGQLIAIFSHGAPAQPPALLFDGNGERIKAGGAISSKPIDDLPSVEESGFAAFDMQGTAKGFGLPFAPDSVAFSRDGTQIAFDLTKPFTDGAGHVVIGINMISLTSGPGPHLFDGAAEDLSFSPDGKQLAFVSNGDIYVVPTDGSAPAKNLTNGKGKSSAPIWSPASHTAK